MSPFKTVWGLLFRLFPCPTQVGLRRVGHPHRDSPVLVTCNFHTTVHRLVHILERHEVDAWLLVAESKGVNVWCAAGGDEFTTGSVVSAVKTSSVNERVDHRRLILPPLGAPGIQLDEVRRQTGWSPRWGPVYAEDLPRYLARRCRRDESMKRPRYHWRERLDTALGSLFPFYLIGAIGFALFDQALLMSYLAVGAAAFLLFFLLCPWLPGKHGLTKAILPVAGLGVALLASEWLFDAGSPIRAELIIAMVLIPLSASELGGLSSTMPSDLDPFLARLGVGGIGNLALAGSTRTELLNGVSKLTHDRATCTGCRQCFEVCPLRVWEMDDAKRAVLARPEACTACRACLVQCPSGAIEARSTRPRRRPLSGSIPRTPP